MQRGKLKERTVGQNEAKTWRGHPQLIHYLRQFAGRSVRANFEEVQVVLERGDPKRKALKLSANFCKLERGD
jgi:hypothetical protein